MLLLLLCVLLCHCIFDRNLRWLLLLLIVMVDMLQLLGHCLLIDSSLGVHCGCWLRGSDLWGLLLHLLMLLLLGLLAMLLHLVLWLWLRLLLLLLHLLLLGLEHELFFFLGTGFEA